MLFRVNLSKCCRCFLLLILLSCCLGLTLLPGRRQGGLVGRNSIRPFFHILAESSSDDLEFDFGTTEVDRELKLFEPVRPSLMEQLNVLESSLNSIRDHFTQLFIVQSSGRMEDAKSIDSVKDQILQEAATAMQSVCAAHANVPSIHSCEVSFRVTGNHFRVIA
jgi:hypothetical protein